MKNFKRGLHLKPNHNPKNQYIVLALLWTITMCSTHSHLAAFCTILDVKLVKTYIKVFFFFSLLVMSQV